MLRTLPVVLFHIHLYGCMWVFAAVNIFGFVFTLTFIEETKGKNLDTLDEDS